MRSEVQVRRESDFPLMLPFVLFKPFNYGFFFSVYVHE